MIRGSQRREPAETATAESTTDEIKGCRVVAGDSGPAYYASIIRLVLLFLVKIVYRASFV
jgi:hypothetical protein